MIKFLKVSLVLVAGLFISCEKDASAEAVPIVPYTTQYPKDEAKIEAFLLENHMEYNHVTLDEVEFTAIPATNPPVGQPGHIKSIREEFIDVDLPNRVKMVRKHAVDYKIYYIPLREGVGAKPTRVDSVLVAYKGRLLDDTIFDSAFNPVWFPLTDVILGWKEIITKFAEGTFLPSSNGIVDYKDYGAGVMFVPSGLAYYNISQAAIPSYTPLIFNFKLMKVNHIDTDGDRIDSRYEGFDANGDSTKQDTDGDGKLDYLEIDDDGDGYLTKYECKRPKILVNGVWVDNGYYPYDGAAVDDLSTPNIDERQGIPDCNGDFTSPTRIRKHLDKHCH